MPKFKLNKLVRDKLPFEYERVGQRVVCRQLSSKEHKGQLISKIIEEVREIKLGGSEDEIASEIADARQAMDDLMAVCGITEEQVKASQRVKYDKKGGFAAGVFVETIELADDDKWVAYYRKSPDIFSEVKNIKNS